MTVLEYLQSLDSETRVAVVGYTDNVLQGIRSLDAKTAAAASFGTWACSEYLAQQVGLAFESETDTTQRTSRSTRHL